MLTLFCEAYSSQETPVMQPQKALQHFNFAFFTEGFLREAMSEFQEGGILSKILMLLAIMRLLGRPLRSKYLPIIYIWNRRKIRD